MTLIFKSCFHSSGVLWQKPDHPLYVQIDWTQVGGGCYAVVDPMDSGHILYLSERSYQIQIRVSMTQDYPLIVLARAGDRRLVVPQAPQRGEPGETSKDGTSGDPDPDTSETLPKPKNTPLPLRLPTEPAFPYISTGGRTTPDSLRRDTYQAIQRWTSQYLAWKKLYQQILQRNAESASMSVQRVSDVQPPEIRSSPSKRSWRRLLNWPLSSLGSFKSKSVKDRRESVVTLTEVNLLSLIFHWGLDSSFRLGGPLTAPNHLKDDLSSLGLALVKILRASGPQAVIMKMKNTCFFLDRWLADKSAPRDSWMLGVPVSLSRSGLPKLIPQRWRRAISSGNRNVVRLVRTILKAYAAFEGTHASQTLSSITEPEPELDQTCLSEFEDFCSKMFWPKVIAEYARENGKKGLLTPRTSYEYMEKPHGSYAAGPNGGPSVLKRHLDTLAWYQHGDEALLAYLECAEEYGTRNAYGKDYKRIQHLVAERSHSPEKNNFVDDIIVETDAVLSLGRVHLLKEPAGKVRTIAIVDYWTQRALSPLHGWMADVLSVLPGDCTFDQEGGVASFQRELLRAQQDTVWSVDLKSATDLIPISLYRAVFKSILPNGLTDKWIALLRDRGFLVLPQEKGLLDHRVIQPGQSVKYGRGQPMGALTSWPSMAIVHHALVLFCATSVGEDPRGFSLYRVLGDDVVIGNEPTASAYSAKCDALRVPISLHKTIAGRLHTFASQAVLENDNVSHLSLVEELGVGSYTQRLELALRAARRGWLDWSRKSLGGFLRHLLSRKDYSSSVKEFAKGRLGTMAQAALVQSMTVAGSALAKLDVSSMGSGPFLLALANKVTALSPNSNDLARKRWDNFDEIQICLALRTLYNIEGELSNNIKEYDRNWALLKALVIGLQVEPQKTIHDWFGLGGPKRNSRLPFVWDEEILFETLQEHYVHALLEKQIPIPGSNYRRYAKAWVPVDKKSRFDAVKEILSGCIALLLEVDGTSTFEMQSVDPWRLVDEVFAELAKIPRLPDFTSYDSFVAGSQPAPGTDRMKRQWVRATSAYAEMMRFCNVQTNFIISFADLSEVQTQSDLVTSSLAALPNPQLFEAFSARWQKDRELSRSGSQRPRPRNARRNHTLNPKGS